MVMATRTILVPIDFSDCSKDAYLFACHLAFDSQATILILHVYDGMASSKEPLIFQPMLSAREITERKIQEFLATIPHEDPPTPKVRHEIKLGIGLPANEILQMVEERSDISEIVMGTRNQYGVKERLLGTISTYVAKNANKKVYLVPHGYRYQKPKHILVASDIYLASYQKMEELINLAKYFKPCNLHFIHIKTQKEDKYSEVENTIRQHMERRLEEGFQFEIRQQTATSVWEGLRAYIDQNPIDLVVVIPSNPGFWKKFTGISKTSQLAMRIHKPILSLG